MTESQKYAPGEVLKVIQANYLQQQEYDLSIHRGEQLVFETMIVDWMDACDLVGPHELWKDLNDFGFARGVVGLGVVGFGRRVVGSDAEW